MSNSEGTETTGDWKEHWRDAGDRMREMREENVGLAERDGKAVSQSCQGLSALLMSSGGECRQTQPTLRLATSASDIILSEKAKHSSEIIQIMPLLADVSGVRRVCVGTYPLSLRFTLSCVTTLYTSLLSPWMCS